MKNYVRLLPLLGLMLAGCAQSAENEAVAPETGATMAASPAATPETAEVPLARLWRAAGHPVIYQGTLELEVADFAATSARLDTLLLQRGAYLTDARETTTEDRHQQVLTLRVPSAQFLALTAGLARLGIVRQKELTSRDVAAELARLGSASPQTLPATPAGAAPAAPSAQWSAEAQVLTEQAAMGTLHLTYFQLRTQEEVAPTAALLPQLRAGLWFGGRVVGLLLVGAAYLWPLLLAGAGWVAYRRWHQNKASASGL